MSFLRGRLGLETAQIPQVDRHGILWLGRGRIFVESGTIQFITKGNEEIEAGSYGILVQMISAILLEPGISITHDALRICARYGTGLVSVGEGGVRYYASMPFGPDDSARSRRQALLWSDPQGSRLLVARRMYAWRMGEVFPNEAIEVLRGMEGQRVKSDYQRLAEEFGVQWRGRKYDRCKPNTVDLANQAIDHVSKAVTSLAMIAVAITGTIPQLGFIHEDSGISFPLDIADLFRSSITVSVAFEAAKRWSYGKNIEQLVRRAAAVSMRRDGVLGLMIDRIKELFDGNDCTGG